MVQEAFSPTALLLKTRPASEQLDKVLAEEGEGLAALCDTLDFK